MMGGASNHWAGWCRVLDAHDFETRSWIPDSGWPIARSDLEPYFGKVRDILELPEFKPNKPISDDIRWVQLIKSGAVNFGEKFRDEIKKDSHIALVLNTYATALNGDGTRITGARIWSAGKDAGTLEAETYVPCTGGIENSRLLLWSNELSNGGVVPHAEALGRYWMEHPQFQGGDIVITMQPDVEFDQSARRFSHPHPRRWNGFASAISASASFRCPTTASSDWSRTLPAPRLHWPNGRQSSSTSGCAAPRNCTSPGNRRHSRPTIALSTDRDEAGKRRASSSTGRSGISNAGHCWKGCDDQRARAVLGEQFEQHGMRRLAVEDDDALDAALDRLDAGLDLGDHAAGNRAVGDQRLGLGDRQFRRSPSCPCRARPARRSGTAGAWR
jgi:hypothetical protein